MKKLNNDLKKIIAAFKYWNLSPVNPQNSYSHRFFMQKIVYLMKSLGFKLKFPFWIYVRGPYSSTLADAYYQYSNEINNLKTDIKLENAEKAILDRIREYVLDMHVKGNRKMEFLEAVTTFQFILEKNKKIAEDDLIMEVKNIKPHLNEYLIAIGLDAVKSLNNFAQ